LRRLGPDRRPSLKNPSPATWTTCTSRSSVRASPRSPCATALRPGSPPFVTQSRGTGSTAPLPIGPPPGGNPARGRSARCQAHQPVDHLSGADRPRHGLDALRGSDDRMPAWRTGWAAVVGSGRGALDAAGPSVDLRHQPGMEVEDPKTHSSRRNSLDPATIAVLATRRVRIGQRAEDAGSERSAGPPSGPRRVRRTVVPPSWLGGRCNRGTQPSHVDQITGHSLIGPSSSFSDGCCLTWCFTARWAACLLS